MFNLCFVLLVELFLLYSSMIMTIWQPFYEFQSQVCENYFAATEILYQTQDVFEAQEYFSHGGLCMTFDGKIFLSLKNILSLIQNLRCAHLKKNCIIAENSNIHWNLQIQLLKTEFCKTKYVPVIPKHIEIKIRNQFIIKISFENRPFR